MTHKSLVSVVIIALCIVLQGCNQGAKGPTVRASTNAWFAAAESNNTEQLTAAASSGSDINAHTRRDYNTPLHIAAIRGNTNSVQVLIDNGANLNVIQEDSRTPLLMACH